MKGFKKGHSGNPKGKPQGAQNKITQTAREIFLSTLELQVPYIASAFDEVREKNPAQYLELFAKYAQYFVPKKSETDLTSKGDQVKTYNIGFSKIPL